MTRAYLDYTRRGGGKTAAAENGISDELVDGFYRMRRGAGAVYRPVAIWHGPPRDPDTLELLDRSPRWQVLYCGRYLWDHSLVWPVCAGQPIDRNEYDYLLARVLHAKEHDPRDPFGTPTGRVDWLTSTPPF